MKYNFCCKENIDGFNKIILPINIKLVEYVFEDMESFGEPIFQPFIEKVIKGDSEYEEITGNICSLSINKYYTTIMVDFFSNGLSNTCEIETEELLLLIQEWVKVNNTNLYLE